MIAVHVERGNRFEFRYWNCRWCGAQVPLAPDTIRYVFHMEMEMEMGTEGDASPDQCGLLQPIGGALPFVALSNGSGGQAAAALAWAGWRSIVRIRRADIFFPFFVCHWHVRAEAAAATEAWC